MISVDRVMIELIINNCLLLLPVIFYSYSHKPRKMVHLFTTELTSEKSVVGCVQKPITDTESDKINKHKSDHVQNK